MGDLRGFRNLCSRADPLLVAQEEVLAIQLGPNGPMVECASQFLWTRQLPPAAFSVLHIPAAFSIDAKGPTMAR